MFSLQLNKREAVKYTVSMLLAQARVNACTIYCKPHHAHNIFTASSSLNTIVQYTYALPEKGWGNFKKDSGT